MLKPLRIAGALLLALSLAVSGCGSSETASTAATNGPAAQTVRQSTSPKQPQQTGASGQKQANETKPRTEAATSNPGGTTAKPTAAAKPTSTAAEPQSPIKPRYRYPLEVQRDFIAACTGASGSKSSCECIIARYESLKVEEGASLSELLGVEVALNNKLRLSRLARQFARDCSSAIT
jgi:hypothetical protein